MATSQNYDVIIIGAGIAGLSLALRLPESMQIALFTKGQFGESNTRYAQGGLAVAIGADDSPELHFQDTIAAGAGLCDEAAVRILVEQGPAAVEWLMSMGVQFDRARDENDTHATKNGLLLGREAAHVRWRVLHAGGDATGAEIERALMKALDCRSSIDLFDETYVSNLLLRDGACFGVQAMKRDGQSFTIESRVTVLANGGAGGLWLHTSNPLGATGDGLALAWRAGAVLTDLEFMQFHPTVLAINGTTPYVPPDCEAVDAPASLAGRVSAASLISEAVRGEGAYLRNQAGERFMVRYHPLVELAPRDVVARAILNEMLSEGSDHEYLDLRHLPAERMHTRFPTISAICRSYGLDLARDLLPIAPAAHYYMGGVMVDTFGRTTVPGLYAVGEAACTGVHGANRLASNSLLEGLVFGIQAADGLKTTTGNYQISPTRRTVDIEVFENPEQEENLLQITIDTGKIQTTRSEIRQIMWKYVSLQRDQKGLFEARRMLNELRSYILQESNASSRIANKHVLPEWAETVNMFKVAELVITAALQRRESRGSHWRSDYDAVNEKLARYHYAFRRVTSDSHEKLVPEDSYRLSIKEVTPRA